MKTAASKLCAKLSGVLRFKRTRAEDESRDMTKDDERRRAPTSNRFRKFEAQRPLKHIPEREKVCGSEMKLKRKGQAHCLV